MTVGYFQEVSRIFVREFNRKVVVTSGLDLSCGHNPINQNGLAHFIAHCFHLSTWLLMDKVCSGRWKNTNHPFLYLCDLSL